MWQAQWEYLSNNTDYEQYPEEINIIIENAYQDKKPYAEWEEESARYRLTFDTMVEEMANDPSSKVKVRRNTKGELLQSSPAAGEAVSASVTLWVVDALPGELAECRSFCKLVQQWVGDILYGQCSTKPMETGCILLLSSVCISWGLCPKPLRHQTSYVGHVS